MSEAHEYPLGYSPEEARRLQVQAALLENILEETLRRAGIGRGMRILDLGCGVGDVSFLASRMVGPTGSVLGVDRSAQTLATARYRATEFGIENVVFEESELKAFEPRETFDAVIGRFILLYLPDPAALLRRLKPFVRPGGLFAIQELDMSATSQWPPSELFAQVHDWIFRAFDAGGAERDMGTKLLSTFLAAGLPRPTMISTTPVTSGPDSPYYEFLTQQVRSMMPIMQKAGIAQPGDIGLDTLTERLRHDAVSHERVLFPQRLVGAWSGMP